MPLQQFKNGIGAFLPLPEKETCLGDDCFAGQQRRLNLRPLGFGPTVVFNPVR